MTALAHWHIEGQNGPLSNECADRGIISFQSLLEWVEQLPYGRNSAPDFNLVFEEECGTCSTKSALIKAIAIENNWKNVKLYLALYEMSESTNPGIKTLLKNNRIAYIPEAHTYLRIDGKIYDVTGIQIGDEPFQKSLQFEEEIDPDQIKSYKKEWHQSKLKLEAKTLNIPPDELWEIREACIALLKSA